jgi:integrase
MSTTPSTCDFRDRYEPRLRWKNGRAYVRYYNPSKTPSQIERALHASVPRAARSLFARCRLDYLEGRFDPWTERPQQGMSLSQAIRQYLSEPQRASTRRCKRYRLGPLDRANPNMLVSGLSADLVRRYCLADGLSSGTSTRYLYQIRHFLDFCQTKGWVDTNEARTALESVPAREKRRRRSITEYLSTDEVKRLLAAIDYDIEVHPRRAGRALLKDVVAVAALTGLRRGELCRLRWKDVDLFDPPKHNGSRKHYGWLNVRHDHDSLTKTGDEDRVPIVPLAHDILLRLRKSHGSSHDYVFTGPKGGKLDGEWISKLFREYRRLAKLPDHFRFHSLRHTCASWLAENRIPLKVIQEILRHSSIHQTMRYAHLIPEVLAEQMVEGMASVDLAI